MENNILYVLPKEKFTGYCKTVLENNKNIYGNETLSYYIENGYKVVTREEMNTLLDNYLKSLCDHWKEITEEKYFYALEVLPPKKYFNGGFFVGECYTYNLYNFYQKYNNKYYTCLQPINKAREDILKSLRQFILNN